MELERGDASSIQFEKRIRDPANISDDWRLATVEEVRNNLQVIKQKGILESWDIARLLDGWVDGPGYRYTIKSEYKPMGHMIVVKTKVSRPSFNKFSKDMYSGVSSSREGRQAAVLLSCDDKIAEVLLWVLQTVKDQAELDELHKIMDKQFGNGRTILHYAADHEYNGEHGLDVAMLFMDGSRFEYGKELVKAQDKNRRTALHIAAFHGHIWLIKFLIEQGKLKTDEKDRNGDNPFHVLVNGNNVDMVGEMLHFLPKEEKKPAILSMDTIGKIPLHKAAANGNTRMMEFLVDCISIDGDDEEKKYISKADFVGETPLHEAARGGHAEAVKYLLQKGSSPLLERNADGKTALHYAVQLENVTEAKQIVKLLLEYLKSDERRTLFLWASATGVGKAEESATGELRNFLIKKRNDYQKNIEAKNSDAGSSHNLLRTAIDLDLDSMAWELITRGADIQQIKGKGSAEDQQQEHLKKFLQHIDEMPDRGRDQPARDDSLGRIHFAEGLAALFLNPFVKTPVAVGISGDWGMGKSSLMLQTEIALLKAAAQLAFPELLQIEKFPGSKELKPFKHGPRKYQEIRKAVTHLLKHSTSIPIKEEEDPLIYFLENYQQPYHDVYRSFAVMDRSDMFDVNGEKSKLNTKVDALGNIPAILTVQYNAWHYRNEFEAWAGLAVEITQVIEETMNMAQRIRACCTYAWNEQRGKVYLVLIIPCLLVSFIAGWIAWAAWLLISRSKHKELVSLKYGCIPVTVLTIAWIVLRQLFHVMKPISQQIMVYVHLPDHSGKLGYQQKVINDIKYLKDQIGEKPSWVWKFIAGQWCWNWLGLYSDNVKGTQIPKMPPASAKASMDDLRIIVFVDDLDRCQDTVILQVLSAVNLVLAACEINVILGMDKKMIARAIAKEFEHSQIEVEDTVDLANKYISKIVQLPLALPDLNDEETKNFLQKQMGLILERRSNEDKSDPIAGQPQSCADAPTSNITTTANQSQSLSGGAPHQTLTVDQNERETPPTFFSTIWSKVSRLLQPCTAFKNCSSQLQQSNGRTKTEGSTEYSSKRLQGAPLNSLLLISNYSPGEQKALSELRKVATDVQKLPREWKRFLTYHRLAWNILSRSGQVKSLSGWQMQLVVWIFCCWQWKDQMNVIIENWEEVVVIKDDLLKGKGEAAEGPSLRSIVEHCIEKKYDEKLQMEKVTERMKIKWKNQWKKLQETLGEYDVSMDCIQVFQKFRLHCEVGHLQWPLDGRHLM